MNLRRATCLTTIVCAGLIAYSQTAQPKFNPAANSPSSQRANFIDFALKQINPQSKDYGQCLDDMRRTVIGVTIENYYYWSNLGAIIGLFVIFSVLLRQRALLKRRELSTARVLCWYHNELFAARDHALRLAGKHAELKRSVDSQIEPRSTVQNALKSDSAEQECRTALSDTTTPALQAESVNEQTLRETIKRMEQQAGREKETLNSLRHQISVLTRRLQEEQQKNRKQASAAIAATGKQRDGNEGQKV